MEAYRLGRHAGTGNICTETEARHPGWQRLGRGHRGGSGERVPRTVVPSARGRALLLCEDSDRTHRPHLQARPRLVLRRHPSPQWVPSPGRPVSTPLLAVESLDRRRNLHASTGLTSEPSPPACRQSRTKRNETVITGDNRHGQTRRPVRSEPRPAPARVCPSLRLGPWHPTCAGACVSSPTLAPVLHSASTTTLFLLP